MENTFLLSEFLVEKANYRPPPLRMDVLLHGHCHHKAILRSAEHERKLLEDMQVRVRQLTDGCCGMAGAFGFEADKYDISVKMGERVLLPEARGSQPSELIVADGFSCREQISQLTNRRALHTAEVVQLALLRGPESTEGDLPEAALVRERRHAVRTSKLQTLAVLGALAVGGIAFVRMMKTEGGK